MQGMTDPKKPEATPAMKKLLDGLVMEPCEKPEGIPDGEPYPTHKGVIKMGKMLPNGGDLTCYQLNTGERVFDLAELARAFGMGLPRQVVHNQGSPTPSRSN
jgi:hypothetical protein